MLLHHIWIVGALYRSKYSYCINLICLTRHSYKSKLKEAHQPQPGALVTLSVAVELSQNAHALIGVLCQAHSYMHHSFSHNDQHPYCVQTLNVVMPAAVSSGGATTQTVPAKVLDSDTITQVKEKLLEQTWKGTSFSQRPHIDSLNLGEFLFY